LKQVAVSININTDGRALILIQMDIGWVVESAISELVAGITELYYTNTAAAVLILQRVPVSNINTDGAVLLLIQMDVGWVAESAYAQQA
jgi:hypothetical protein